MDYFLPPEVKKIRAWIKQISQQQEKKFSPNYQEISEEAYSVKKFTKSFVDSGSKGEKEILVELKRGGLNPFLLVNDFNDQKALEKALWAVEELAGYFPLLALKLAVHNFLFLRISELARKGQKNSSSSVDRLAENEDAFPGNHIFLPPFNQQRLRSFLNKVSLPADSNFQEPSFHLLGFPFSPVKYLLVPEVSQEHVPGKKGDQENRINYFMIKKEDFQVTDFWPEPDMFPLRPIKLRIKRAEALFTASSFLLTLEEPWFQKILADFKLVLIACFSGWIRFCWSKLALNATFPSVRFKPAAELSVFLCEEEKLHYYLYRLLRVSGKMDYPHLEELDRLSQKALALSSRAWKINRFFDRLKKLEVRRKDET